MSHLPQAPFRIALIACLLALAGLLAGCPTLAPRDSLADAVADWIGNQRFSPWTNFYDRDGAGMPRHPDGFSLGNREIFAAIGTDPNDLTCLTTLCGQGHTVSRISRVTPASLTLLVGGQEWPLREFASQRARRVQRTGILITEAKEGNINVTVVDFAPLNPDLDALVRLVLVANEGATPLNAAAVQMDLHGRSEVRTIRRTLAAVDRGRLLIYGRLALSVRQEGAEPGSSFRSQRVSLAQPLGNLRPGQRRLAIFVIAPLTTADQEPAASRTLRRQVADPAACLRHTAEAWRAWYDEPLLRCSDERLSSLMDSLLQLMRSHVGARAIHTGSLRYAHNRIYLRDSYWVQRAFLEAGRPREARMNLSFLSRMRQQNGLASYYTLPERVGHGYGYQRVELPHYLVLMVRDAERWAGLDPKPYWPMVKACLEHAAVDDGYQAINSDETWLLAVPADELALQLDNTWLLRASARYVADLARRMGDAAAAERFGRIAAAADRAARNFAARSACQKGGNYWDRLPISGVIARGVMLEPERDPSWRRLTGSDADLEPLAVDGWLQSAWRDLHFDEGIRSSPRSTEFDGGTPGYVLWAASHLHLPFAGHLVGGIQKLSAPMGNFWELNSTTDPKWGMEKRRLWDSAVVLAGLVHHLFGITPIPDGVVVDPNPPAHGWVDCAGFPVRDHTLGMQATPQSLRLTWDGKTILDADEPVSAVIRAGRVARTFPRAPQAPAPQQGQPAGSVAGWPAGMDKFLGHATPRCIILHQNAPNHARRIAAAIFKQKQFVPTIAPLDRAQLAQGRYTNAIIIARSIPPPQDRPYAVVQQGRTTQVWVRNTGHVWADTDPLVDDLVRFSLPRLREPMPYPDAMLDLARRLGATPDERVRVQISASEPMQMACGPQSVTATSFDHRCTFQEMQVQEEGLKAPFALVGSSMCGGVSDLVVTTESPMPASVTVTITLPVTCWVVSSRRNPDWDRLADPVAEYRDPDGSRRIVFVLHPGRGPARKSVTLVVTDSPTRER